MCGADTLRPWMLYCIIVLILGFEDTLSLSDAVGEKYADPSARIACQGLWQASLCSAEQGAAPKVLGSLRRRGRRRDALSRQSTELYNWL